MKTIIFRTLCFTLILSSFSAYLLRAQDLPENSIWILRPLSEDLSVRTLHIDSMIMSDPFILADPLTRNYYMTGTGGMLWKSTDLNMWTGPYPMIQIDTTSWMGSRPMVWAAEFHNYKGHSYCFTTFTNENITVDKNPGRYDVSRRSSHILRADSPEGPYRTMNNKIYIPEKQSNLDGTLWIEDGTPYLIYCHEWLQIVDGTMDAIQLSEDLSEPLGEAFTLFKASEGPWALDLREAGHAYGIQGGGGFVTDGPFLFKTQTGKLGMLWSSLGKKNYAQGVAYSESGKLRGPWIHEPEALNPDNSGHGMMFRTFEGKLLMCLHVAAPGDDLAPRKPVLLEVNDCGDKIKIMGPYRP